MHISELQQLAKQDKELYNFCLRGPEGALNAHWIDPWMGMFQIEGQTGFMIIKDWLGTGCDHQPIHCADAKNVDVKGEEGEQSNQTCKE